MLQPRTVLLPSLLSQLRSATAAWLFLVCGASAVALHSWGPAALAAPLFVVIEVGTIVATVVGIIRHQKAGTRKAWWAVVGTEIVFFGIAIVRFTMPTVVVTPGIISFLDPDFLSIIGYLLLTYALMEMLRCRRADSDDPARADALLIGLVTASAAWTFLIEPRMGTSAADIQRSAAAFYPVVDVLLLVMVTQLILADGVRTPALWLFGASMCSLFLADFLYTILYANQQLVDQWLQLFNSLALTAYVLISAAALHPTVRTLTEPQPVVTRTFGKVRTIGIAVALLVPSIIATLWPAPTGWSAGVRLTLSAGLTMTIVGRIVRANNSRARAEQAARHRATHDSLTDLPNRELLTETVARWAEHAAAGGKEISLLFIDLDRFKMVNDSWGHGVGDELLRAVADRLCAAVRSEDLVCRIGGDEFVIALASRSHSALAETLAQRLLKDFAEPFSLSIGNIVITPSIGVAQSRGAAHALDLIRDADTAMYKAKGAGRNGYAFFDASLRAQARMRVDLEQAFRGALEREELSVHYQPIVDLNTEELSGFEALMRWHHRELGSVSPLDFIPIAEDTGLIVSSGAWLLEEAASQLATWRATRPPHLPPLHMSVNISFRQLRDSALVGIVRRVLRRTGLPASALWLEITESGMMEDPDSALSTLQELRALGVTLCIDDFGTGYSSLSYLKRFPVGIVKIDRSFISTLGEDRDDEAIVRTVVAMAHALSQQVVAEGVETVVQRDWLRELGCDLVQGWLYGAPRPANAQAGWVMGHGSARLRAA